MDGVSDYNTLWQWIADAAVPAVYDFTDYVRPKSRPNHWSHIVKFTGWRPLAPNTTTNSRLLAALLRASDRLSLFGQQHTGSARMHHCQPTCTQSLSADVARVWLQQDENLDAWDRNYLGEYNRVVGGLFLLQVHPLQASIAPR